MNASQDNHVIQITWQGRCQTSLPSFKALSFQSSAPSKSLDSKLLNIYLFNLEVTSEVVMAHYLQTNIVKPDEEAANDEATALRVLVIVRPGSDHRDMAWQTPEGILGKAAKVLPETQIINHDPPNRLMLMQRWPHSICLVFDVHHNSYDADLGHLPECNAFPVRVVFLRRRISSKQASPALRDRVNSEVALAHNLNGEHSMPPFMEDHTSVIPTYENPRDSSLFSQY
jgi:hypothetical protein